jgi:hypothetical protein
LAELALQRFCAVPPPLALERAVHWLTEHGYQVSARADREAQLFHPGGLSPEPPSHRLKVRADGKNLELTYQPASVFDAGPGPAEQGRLEKLLDAVAEAVASSKVLSYREWSAEQGSGQQAPAGAPRFCSTCGTRAEPGATVCAVCASPL